MGRPFWDGDQSRIAQIRGASDQADLVLAVKHQKPKHLQGQMDVYWQIKWTLLDVRVASIKESVPGRQWNVSSL
jgi:hypothetical protein